MEKDSAAWHRKERSPAHLHAARQWPRPQPPAACASLARAPLTRSEASAIPATMPLAARKLEHLAAYHRFSQHSRALVCLAAVAKRSPAARKNRASPAPDFGSCAPDFGSAQQNVAATKCCTCSGDLRPAPCGRLPAALRPASRLQQTFCARPLPGRWPRPCAECWARCAPCLDWARLPTAGEVACAPARCMG